MASKQHMNLSTQTLKQVAAAKVSAARVKRIATGLLGRLSLRKADTAVATNGASRALSESAIAIDPSTAFQPDPRLIESYARFDESDVSNIVRPKAGIVLYGDIPYSLYGGVWQFHPNRIGRYMVAARPIDRAIRTAVRLRRFFAELPNGGLALYYPRSIPTARFQTPEFVYSGISQAQLLAGYSRLIAQDKSASQSEWRDTAVRIALGLQFPVEAGGVSADGKVILEGPNFRSCPEVILNGWLDALIHLWDYLRVAPDVALTEFYRRNVQALTELLPYFDDSSQRLSRYSNLCPYTFRADLVRRSETGPPALRVEYLSLKRGYCDRLIVDLRQMGPPGCLYDNGIQRAGGHYVEFSLSVASLYNIRIEIGAECRRLSFDPGAADERSTVPHRTFQRESIWPAMPYDGRVTVFLIRPRELGMIAGCATNFTKHGGENFYHPYHVAALYHVALSAEGKERHIIAEFAARWLSYITEPSRPPARFVFADMERVVETIDRSRALR